jgi:hypothetical protein
MRRHSDRYTLKMAFSNESIIGLSALLISTVPIVLMVLRSVWKRLRPEPTRTKPSLLGNEAHLTSRPEPERYPLGAQHQLLLRGRARRSNVVSDLLDLEAGPNRSVVAVSRSLTQPKAQYSRSHTSWD